MQYTFSDRSIHSKPNLIRVIDAMKNENPDFISFAEGNPASEVIPAEKIRKMNELVYEGDIDEVLLYGPCNGYPKLKGQVLDRLKRIKQINPDGNDILLTTGAQQGLYLAYRIFCNEGDAVLLEDISYICSLDAINDFLAKPVAVKSDDDGMNIEALEEALKTTPNVKMIYVVPTFNNPTGVTLSMEKRRAIYELACKYDVMILEDDPYGDLRYEGEHIPPIKSIDTEGRVIYVGTFSKILAAGLRVGYMCCSQEVCDKAGAAKHSIDSGSNITSHMICSLFMENYDMEENIKEINSVYEKKWRLMGECLKREMPENYKVLKASGGMFYFIRTPEGVDENDVFEACLKHNVGVVPSVGFAPDPEHPAGGFRLCFAPMNEYEIEEGVRRIGEAVREL